MPAADMRSKPPSGVIRRPVDVRIFVAADECGGIGRLPAASVFRRTTSALDDIGGRRRGFVFLEGKAVECSAEVTAVAPCEEVRNGEFMPESRNWRT